MAVKMRSQSVEIKHFVGNRFVRHEMIEQDTSQIQDDWADDLRLMISADGDVQCALMR